MLITRHLCLFFAFHITCLLNAVNSRVFTIPDYPNIKICNGETKGEHLAYSDGDAAYKRIKAMYENCTHIIGNLVIADLREYSTSEPSRKMDYSFFESIVEVNGFVSIHGNSMPRLPLTNLRVIRGLKTYVKDKTKAHRALYIGINNHEDQMSFTKKYLKEVDLRSLQSIVHGDVVIDSNPGLCYIPNTIDWRYLLEDATKQKVSLQDGKYNTEFCKEYVQSLNISGVTYQGRKGHSCHEACPVVNGKRHCWGPSRDQCQKIAPCSRSDCKKRRCFLDPLSNVSLCCDAQCTGGCKSTSECVACRNFLNGKECVSFCPARKKYDPYSRMHVDNPDARLPFGSFCVKKCPEYSIIKENACEASCDLRQNVLINGKQCVPCPGGDCGRTNCVIEDKLKKIRREKGKLLHSTSSFTATRSLLKELKGCKQVQGDLMVFGWSGFAKRKKLTHEIAKPEDFYNLKDVEVWVGNIHLDLKHYEEIKNLSFLSNLQTIRSLEEGLQISRSKLEYLGLTSLKYVVVEKVLIFSNDRLCYLDHFDTKRFRWAYFTYAEMENKPEAACRAAGAVCDPSCDPARGCWGPGPDMCVACRHLKAGATCVDRCGRVRGFYFDNDTRRCRRCHSECKDSCTGPAAAHCDRGCRHARLNSTCVAECPAHTFLDAASAQCLPCSPSCRAVPGRHCSGPRAALGAGGCTACRFVRLDGRCVDACPKANSLFATDTALEVDNATRTVLACAPCDPLCNGCSKIATNCDRCRFFKHADKCVKECPSEDAYATEYSNSTGERLCKLCDKQCRNGCSGPGPVHCKACKLRKVYLDAEKTQWLCNSTCPADQPYAHFEYATEDSVCMAIPASSQVKLVALGSGLGAFAIVCFIVGAIVYVCVQRRRALVKKECELLQARYRRQLDDQLIPLNETDQQPNFGQLRIIGANQLTKGYEIGSGAFGTVFVGVWRPSKEKPTDTQVEIKVAIKTLKDSGGEGLSSALTNEFLSEAHVMASVEHPFCISLLGVCLSSQMQLISEFMPLGSLADYLPRHRAELGSQQLLTWAVQIAKGMGYLESRGIIHRDLAARNVLLQSMQQVRITDFGLAKLMDEQENGEFTAEGGRFPVKWLAIECLRRRVFSHKSDVWAFGVTLWEVCTLGRRPYQELRAADLVEFLERGERLKQPDICTLDMYMLMIKCWLLDADSRPTFEELVLDLSKMASDPARYLVIPHDNTARMAPNRSAGAGYHVSPYPARSSRSATPEVGRLPLASVASASGSSSDEAAVRKPLVRGPPVPHGLAHLTDEVNRRKAESPLRRLTSDDLRYATDPMLREDSNEVFADYLTPTEENGATEYLLPSGGPRDEYLEADGHPSAEYYNEPGALRGGSASYVNADALVRPLPSTEDDYLSPQDLSAHAHNPEYGAAAYFNCNGGVKAPRDEDAEEEENGYLLPLEVGKGPAAQNPQYLVGAALRKRQEEVPANNYLPVLPRSNRSTPNKEVV